MAKINNNDVINKKIGIKDILTNQIAHERVAYRKCIINQMVFNIK